MESTFKNKKYNQYNFHKHTFCVFKEVTSEGLDFANANYVSKTNSAYIFTEVGVYRKSNHWGRVANCKWKLVANGLENNNRIRIGFANWTDFKSENENEANYIIVLDPNNLTVDYLHFTELDVQSQRRTAKETATRLKEIRQIVDNRKWMEYYEIENEHLFLKTLIQQMIDSKTPLRQLLNDFYK